MAKMVRITSCESCPDFIEEGGMELEHYCCVEDRDISYLVFRTADFPEWCPLDDA